MMLARRATIADSEIRPNTLLCYRYAKACALLQYDPVQVEEASRNELVFHGTGRLDAFYFRNNMYLAQDQLIGSLERISHLPLMIVQGGHDVIAPPEAAYRVHQAWPGSVRHIAHDAGHSPAEPGIRRKVIQALDQFKRERRFDAQTLAASGPV